MTNSGHTFDTDEILSGHSVWVPPDYVQVRWDEQPDAELDIDDLKDRVKPVTNKFFDVLTRAMMAGNRSEEYLNELTMALETVSDEMSRGAPALSHFSSD